MRYFMLTIVATLALAGTSLAATINVPGDYTTIQAAVDAASNGDEILVAPGTYTGTVSMLGKAITLRSTDGATSTIIDAEDQGQVFVCDNAETALTVINGFHVTGGLSNGNGGGLHCANSSPTFVNCIISENSASVAGGGLHCWNASPTIMGCYFTENSAANGGGIHIAGTSNPLITDTRVCGNTPNQIVGDYIDGGGNDIQPECPLMGACCTTDICHDSMETDCLYWGGHWLGTGSSCDDCDPPPAPRGACCANGICVEVSEAECWDVQGSYAGDDITCEDAACPSPCLGDIDGNGVVAVDDVLTVIANWGACP